MARRQVPAPGRAGVPPAPAGILPAGLNNRRRSLLCNIGPTFVCRRAGCPRRRAGRPPYPWPRNPPPKTAAALFLSEKRRADSYPDEPGRKRVTVSASRPALPWLRSSVLRPSPCLRSSRRRPWLRRRPSPREPWPRHRPSRLSPFLKGVGFLLKGVFLLGGGFIVAGAEEERGDGEREDEQEFFHGSLVWVGEWQE